MSILYNIFGTILKFIYDFVGNFGWSIVLLALFGKLITLPLTIKQQKSMQMMKAVQPEIEKVQEKYKNNQQRQGEELWKIYDKYNYNPMSSCLPLLLQFPFIIGLFGVVRNPAEYVFGGTMANIDMSFLWIPDLTRSTMDIVKSTGFGVQTFTAMIIPLVIVVLMYIQQKQTPQTGGSQAGMMSSMNSVMLVMMGYFSITFTSALAVYWAAQTGFGVLQTFLMNKFFPQTPLEATVVEEKPERVEEPWEQGAKKKKKKKKK